ncbi:MAG TPA: glucose-6-phosphate dehydrogenase [Candidatus Polarisedimenticolia bacterium]|nr:glucose-6-phosphate dehydrogenase [Candidatus Polarisedimenticolia bacterium]
MPEASHRPLEVQCAGIDSGTPPEPSIAVIFGAGGDLSRRELIPSLYQLFREHLLPDPFAVIGFSRRAWSDEEFRTRMREAFGPGPPDPAVWAAFARLLHFTSGDFADPASFDRLAQRIAEVRAEHGTPDNVFFHLAAQSEYFGPIVEQLAQCGLHRGDGWRRLVVEKPFGADRTSARELDRRLRAVFPEESIYRIDHFLGKETVQNMLVFRFANPSFEPIWNRNYIDHVQITVAEEIGIGTRAAFYEKAGVVRDMLQNHLLQLLCMTAMEPPVHYDGASLRDETLKVLRSMRPVDPDRDAVRGQYGPGAIRAEPVPGYRQEQGIGRDSPTPTYVGARVFLDNWRWEGVPFFLRTGKRMERKLTEICIQFKPTPHLMFPVDPARLQGNLLVFRLAPQEGIIQVFAAKRPGPDLTMCPVRMNFLYSTAFELEDAPRAYAWLLREVMQGDQTLFARADWIDQAWAIVDPIHERWESMPLTKDLIYPSGSWGPPAADRLIEGSGRAWRQI